MASSFEPQYMQVPELMMNLGGRALQEQNWVPTGVEIIKALLCGQGKGGLAQVYRQLISLLIISVL